MSSQYREYKQRADLRWMQDNAAAYVTRLENIVVVTCVCVRWTPLHTNARLSYIVRSSLIRSALFCDIHYVINNVSPFKHLPTVTSYFSVLPTPSRISFFFFLNNTPPPKFYPLPHHAPFPI